MLDRESQNDSTTVQWSADGNSFIIMDPLEFEEVSTLDDVLMMCFCNNFISMSTCQYND